MELKNIPSKIKRRIIKYSCANLTDHRGRVTLSSFIFGILAHIFMYVMFISILAYIFYLCMSLGLILGATNLVIALMVGAIGFTILICTGYGIVYLLCRLLMWFNEHVGDIEIMKCPRKNTEDETDG